MTNESASMKAIEAAKLTMKLERIMDELDSFTVKINEEDDDTFKNSSLDDCASACQSKYDRNPSYSTKNRMMKQKETIPVHHDKLDLKIMDGYQCTTNEENNFYDCSISCCSTSSLTLGYLHSFSSKNSICDSSTTPRITNHEHDQDSQHTYCTFQDPQDNQTPELVIPPSVVFQEEQQNKPRPVATRSDDDIAFIQEFKQKFEMVPVYSRRRRLKLAQRKDSLDDPTPTHHKYPTSCTRNSGDEFIKKLRQDFDKDRCQSKSFQS